MKQSYYQRSKLETPEINKKLFLLMEEKKSNLALSCDLTSAAAVLRITEQIGDKICLLKTHIDILEDFQIEFIEKLKKLAAQKKFLLFEDRKFGDIGNTVSKQYGAGIYKISSWADFTNASALPGYGLVEGLHQEAKKYIIAGMPRGLLLWAQITSTNNYADERYLKNCLSLANRYYDFVAGFIGNGGDASELIKLKTKADDRFVIMTPGIKFATQGDELGQRYSSPQEIISAGSDVLIVGRGIYESSEPRAEAEKYRQAGWTAYQDSLK